MLTVGIICALVAVANAGYASSSSGAGTSGGLYNRNSYGTQTYSSNFPYTSYSGYSSAGGVPYAPTGPFVNPFEFQNAYQQYFNSLSALNAKSVRHLTTSYAGDGASVSAYARHGPTRYESKKIKNLFQQQLAYQAALQNQIQANINAIRDAAYGGAFGYSNPIPNRFGGASAGTGAYGSGGAFAGTSGGATGSYGGTGPHTGTYGGTYGGPNYASAGGAVSSNGYQQQHASIYPANPHRPNLDSRFGADSGPGVSHSSGPPGFVGVSSFSSSSDINGQQHRESATSVNNNGKVTTYHTRNK